MKFYCLILIFFLLCPGSPNSLQAQSTQIERLTIGVESGTTERLNEGLTLSFKELYSQIEIVYQATLHSAPASSYKKRVFTLEITVSNSGANDIAIYDWSFHAACPENNLGAQWQENSHVLLTTAYIPDDIYIVLKPGDKKVLQTTKSDFYSCLPKNESSLLVAPSFVKAIMVCAVLPIPQTQTSTIDPLLLQMIADYQHLMALGETEKGEEKKMLLLEIAEVEYPTQIEQILKLLTGNKQKENVYSHKKLGTTLIDQVNKATDTLGKQTSLNDSSSRSLGYGNVWYFIQSDKALQYRMALLRQLNDTCYLKIQVRLNKTDAIFCDHPNCEGYLWLMSYPTITGNGMSEHQFYFPNSFESIYELPFEVPVSLKPYPSGIKPYWSDEKKLIVYKNANTNEEHNAYILNNCVDNKMLNYVQHRCKGFDFNEAIWVK